MKTLHLFNPSHDEALAANNPYYYPSKIARHLANEWGALPMLWANKGDAIWLTDESPLTPQLLAAPVEYVYKKDLNAHFWQSIDSIAPWGWDPLVHQQLLKAGAPQHLLPTPSTLNIIRQLSSRQSTPILLSMLRKALAPQGVDSIGNSFVAQQMEQVTEYAKQHGSIMAKSLWSCSGRGVFQLSPTLSPSEAGRVNRLLREQGGIELEPLYNRLLDFALEFDALPNGTVRYVGLSMFHTSPTGGYTGNRIAPQSVLRAELAQQFTAFDSLTQVCESTLTNYLAGRYTGPLGIDMMMVLNNGQPYLHPCIELNLRRTMGYVSLAVAQRCQQPLPAFATSLFHFDNTET